MTVAHPGAVPVGPASPSDRGSPRLPALVWMYWEQQGGCRRPAYLDLCMESVERHAAGLEVRLLGPADVIDWLPDLDRATWRRLPSAVHRSDYLRIHLLHRHGGLWLDADVVVLDSLRRLLVPLRHADLLGWGAEMDRFYNNLFAAWPGSAFLGAWIEEVERRLAGCADWGSLPRAALGQHIAGSLARQLGWHCLPMSSVAPVPWYEWRRFLSRLESPARVTSGGPVTVMLWNAVMEGPLAAWSRPELIRGRILLSRLLRMALGLSTVEAESRGLPYLQAASRLRFSRAGRSLELRARRLGGRLGSQVTTGGGG